MKTQFQGNINFKKSEKPVATAATKTTSSSSAAGKTNGGKSTGGRPTGKRPPMRRRKKESPMFLPSTESVKAPFPIKKGEKPVKVGSLMGLEEVGQCIFIEYENDMIIVDAGMEFSAQETLGADYIIPDVRYVKKNIHKLRGIVLSHGHLDHVGALRDLLPELGFPTIYTTPLTLGIVKKTFDRRQDIPKIKYKIVDPDVDILKLGCFSIEFIHVNHNIPETMAMSINTPKGVIFNSSDFKIDHTPAIGRPADIAKIARIGLEGVKLYIGDSLGSNKKGVTASESTIGNNLIGIVEKTKGRVIVATFASNVGRVIQLIQSAIRNNRTVYLSGRSMINNVEICQELGYINVPKNYVRKLSNNVEDIPDERVMILCTGAQGEEFSALARMARGDHHQVSLRTGDTVLVSASVIPGNEIQAMKMKDNLVEKGVNLITTDFMDIHASGHGGAEDHKLMLNLVNPDFFLPYYMNTYFRYQHKLLGLEMGIPEENIMLPHQNGAIIEMYDAGCRIGDERINVDTVLIDGKGKGHLSGEYVIKARQIMAQDGIVSLILKIDADTKALVGNVQVESRGFVYSSEVRKVHTSVVEFVKSKYTKLLKKTKETRLILKQLKEDLSEFINAEVGRKPMIIPMFVYMTEELLAQMDKEKIAEEEDVVGMTIEEQGGDDHVEAVEEIISKENNKTKIPDISEGVKVDIGAEL